MNAGVISNPLPLDDSGLYLPAHEAKRRAALRAPKDWTAKERRPIAVPVGDFELGNRRMGYVGPHPEIPAMRGWWERRGRGKKDENGLSIFIAMAPGDDTMHCWVGYSKRWPAVEVVRAVGHYFFRDNGWEYAVHLYDEDDVAAIRAGAEDQRTDVIPFHARLFNVEAI